MSPIRQEVHKYLVERLPVNAGDVVNRIAERIAPRHPDAALNDVKQVVVEEIDRVRKCLAEGGAS